MSIATLPSNTDPAVTRVAGALADYQKEHPQASIDIRRSSSASIHVRVVDPAFAGQDRVSREDRVWPLLERLPDDVFTQITVLLLLTPDDCGKSHANLVYFGRPDPAPAGA